MVAGTLGTLGTIGALTPLAAGCSGDGGGPDDERTAAEDKRLRREAARQSLDLLARYDATAEAHSALADRLRPLRAATMRHADVLEGDGDDHRNGNGNGNGNDGKDADGGGQRRHRERTAPGRRPDVPADRQAALTALGDAERGIAGKRTAALVKAPPETARLLASLAAAGAAHAYLLGAGDGDAGQNGDDGKDDG
ncbi:hypothetical protein K378_03658 [Streptomyces sp. Amel2xB2]|uniref:hypothetical protein n=1 Tax=Streptomyces sp. Amel2xB2 TaxID=1305829 RepID=UPI000DB9F97E|nr:hypothetical protein [Streptomyces sp. Amel2xB2]RAJ63543.1 hypothetical protein K378_03658 [Streptomyces sp. Amel2xB2]